MPGHARHLQHPNRRSPLLGAPPVRLAWLPPCSLPPLANSFMCTVGRPSRASRPKRLGPAPCSCFFRGAERLPEVGGVSALSSRVSSLVWLGGLNSSHRRGWRPGDV